MSFSLGTARRHSQSARTPCVRLVRTLGSQRINRNAGVDPTAPTAHALSDNAELFVKEFEDVVLLRQVWRLDDGNDEMSAAERSAYRAEADKF